MKLLRRQFLHLAAGAAAMPVVSQIARAQTYPSRAITILVPSAAGGSTDTIGRLIVQPMRTSLGEPIILENVTGASGTIGVCRAAHAVPDGYTLSIGPHTFLTAPSSLCRATQDLLAGHIDFYMATAVDVLPHLRDIKTYAVTGNTRLAAAPDIPTVDEEGLWSEGGCTPEDHGRWPEGSGRSLIWNDQVPPRPPPTVIVGFTDVVRDLWLANFTGSKTPISWTDGLPSFPTAAAGSPRIATSWRAANHGGHDGKFSRKANCAEFRKRRGRRSSGLRVKRGPPPGLPTVLQARLSRCGEHHTAGDRCSSDRRDRPHSHSAEVFW